MTRPNPVGRLGTRRGAAMVEAIIVIPFFFIIFASMAFIGNLYGGKQRTIREAKQAAWVHASNNCKSSGGSISVESAGNPMVDAQNEDGKVNSGPAGTFSGSDEGMVKLEGELSMGSATITAEVTPGAGIKRITRSLKTTTSVQCNEAPVEGNLFNLFKFGWDTFKQW